MIEYHIYFKTLSKVDSTYNTTLYTITTDRIEALKYLYPYSNYIIEKVER